MLTCIVMLVCLIAMVIAVQDVETLKSLVNFSE